MTRRRAVIRLARSATLRMAARVARRRAVPLSSNFGDRASPASHRGYLRRGAPMVRLAGARRPLASVATFAVAGLLASCGESDVVSTGGWSTHAARSLGPRQEMGVAAVGGQVYVVGGFDGAGHAVATVEAYDPPTDRWIQRASLPAPLHHVNLASVAGKLYVVGALSGGSFGATGTTLVYDPALDTWTPLPSMPAGTPRRASGAAVRPR